eukprot:3896723-Prymnesium_polylepis.2
MPPARLLSVLASLPLQIDVDVARPPRAVAGGPVAPTSIRRGAPFRAARPIISAMPALDPHSARPEYQPSRGAAMPKQRHARREVEPAIEGKALLCEDHRARGIVAAVACGEARPVLLSVVLHVIKAVDEQACVWDRAVC